MKTNINAATMNCNWKYSLILFSSFLLIGIVTIATILLTSNTKSSNSNSSNSTNNNNNNVNSLFSPAASESEKLASVYMQKLLEKLNVQCSKHSSALWKYKSSSNNLLTNYLNTSYNYAQFIKSLQSELRSQNFIISSQWKTFINPTLRSSIQLLLNFIPSSTTSRSDYVTAHHLKSHYKSNLSSIVTPYLVQISQYEEEEEAINGGPTPDNYPSRVALNQDVWMNFHNKFGSFAQSNIYPAYFELLKRQFADSDSEHHHVQEEHGLELEPHEPELSSFTKTSYNYWYNQLDSILDELSPLYTQLHGYVRGISIGIQQEGSASDGFPWLLKARNSCLPVHLITPFGSSWGSYHDDVTPYDQIHMGHITFNILNKGLNAKQLGKIAANYFETLFFDKNRKLSDSFWSHSKFLSNEHGQYDVGHEFSSCNDDVEELDDVCSTNPAASDYKTTFCDDVNYENFKALHAKLGNVRYLMAAQPGVNLPKRGIHPILLNANGVLWSLLASSPKYLDSLGLWDHVDWSRSESEPLDYTSTINFQFSQALLIIPSMIQFIVHAKWTHALLFDEQHKYTLTNSNCVYWSLREALEGIVPPSTRNSSQFDSFWAFDTESKYNEFFGSILGFQLHSKLCLAGGEYDPDSAAFKSLQQCELQGNEGAARVLKEIMSLDHSKPLLELLEELTGSRKLSIEPLLDYFEPLYDYLVSTNYERGYSIGWDSRFNNYKSCI